MDDSMVVVPDSGTTVLPVSHWQGPVKITRHADGSSSIRVESLREVLDFAEARRGEFDRWAIDARKAGDHGFASHCNQSSDEIRRRFCDPIRDALGKGGRTW
jgi:hypothetical protein